MGDLTFGHIIECYLGYGGWFQTQCGILGETGVHLFGQKKPGPCRTGLMTTLVYFENN